MKPQATCSTKSFYLPVALAGLLCAGCPEDNPKRCDSDDACVTKIEEGVVVDGDDGDGDLSADKKTFCHPTKHYCYAGCSTDADCTNTELRMNKEQPEKSSCNQQTHHCEAPASGDGGSDGGDAAADLAMDLGNGEACVEGKQCQSGACVDEVCCETACQGRCTSCALAGKLGQCEVVPAGQDPRGDCVGSDADCNGACSGDDSGSCVYPTNEKSCGTASCADAALTESFCDGAGVCKAAEAKGCGGYLCDSSGTACKEACTKPNEATDCDPAFKCVDGHCANPQPLGADCGDNDYACESNMCTDGICCSVDACPDCQHCAGEAGTCTANTAGPAPAGQCPGDASCNAGQCNDSGACAYHPAATVCDKRCVTGMATVAVCSATGQCEDGTPVNCYPYLCAGDACATHCTGPAQCATDSLCDRTNAHAAAGVCLNPGDIVDATPANIQAHINTCNLVPYIRAAPGTYGALTFDNQTCTVIANGTVVLDPAMGTPAITVNSGTVTLQGLTIQGARGENGDGIRCFAASGANLTVIDSKISGNGEQGVDANNCDVTLRRNTIEGNDGGGLTLFDGTFTIINNVITNNGKGGAGGSAVGGAQLGTGTVSFINNTVSNNDSDPIFSAGINCSGAYVIRNSILWDNSGSGEYSSCSFEYSNVAGGIPAGTGNLSSSCQLDAQRKPASGSVCINGGNSTAPGISQIDITGGPRLKGTAVDMGAYEVQ